jgi:hypothetical protein
VAEYRTDDLWRLAAAKSIVALPCLSPWRVMGGSFALATRASNRWLIHACRSGVPSSRVNTRPLSVQTPAQAIRSASWTLRQAFSTSVVAWSITMIRSESSDFTSPRM